MFEPERVGYTGRMDQEEKRYRLLDRNGGEPAYFTGTRDDAGRWALAESEKSGWCDWQLEVNHGGAWVTVVFPAIEDPGPIPPGGGNSI
jgi:hypothetical protein